MVSEDRLEDEYYSVWMKTDGPDLILFFDKMDEKRCQSLIERNAHREKFIVTKTTVEITHDFD